MKISERGQITISKPLRERFGFHKHVEVDLLPAEKGIVIQKRSRQIHPVDQAYGILNRKLSTDKYIEEIRGR